MYGYEAVAGMQFDAGLMATTDFDLLWDARGCLKLAALRDDVAQAGVLAIFRKLGRSFEPLSQGGFRASRKADFFVDQVKQAPDRFPEIQGPKKDDICYATQNRQDAVKALAEQCDLVIVVGSPNSSNSRRLKEVAVARGIDGYLIDGPEEIDPAWLQGKQRIGATAGASAPEILVQRVVDRISQLTSAVVSQAVGVEESVSFPLPKDLLA